MGHDDMGSRVGFENRLQNLVERAQILLRKRFGCEVDLTGEAALHFEDGSASMARPEDLSLLIELKKLLSENILELQRKHLEVIATEKRLVILMDEIPSLPSNVLFFDNHRRIPTKSLAPRPKIYYAVPCLIEGQTHWDRYRLAFEIHHVSQRVGFISYQDIDPDVRMSAALLSELGPVTVFLSQIESLVPNEQSALLTFLKEERKAHHPHLITAIQSSYADIARSQDLLTQLVDRLSVSIIRMNKPFRDYQSLGLVSHLYESLLDRSLENN